MWPLRRYTTLGRKARPAGSAYAFTAHFARAFTRAHGAFRVRLHARTRRILCAFTCRRSCASGPAHSVRSHTSFCVRYILSPVGLCCVQSQVISRSVEYVVDRQRTLRLAGPALRMSRQTPISISSESDSPIAVMITSASETAQTISSDRNPDVALVSKISSVLEEDDDQRSDTIQHVKSESDELQYVEVLRRGCGEDCTRQARRVRSS